MAKKKPSRNVELKWVSPLELADSPNPKNWKSHPKRQQRMVSSLISRNGWALPLVYNSRTGQLIDGHGRLEIAIKEGMEEIPVMYGDWSEAQEKELLASLNNVDKMANVDKLSLDSLTAEVGENLSKKLGDQGADEILKGMIDINAFNEKLKERSPLIARHGARKRLGKKKVKPPKTKSREREKQSSLAQWSMEPSDALTLPSGNTWGIPNLLSKRLYKEEEYLPELTYNGHDDTHHTLAWYNYSTKHKFKNKPPGGFLCFYCDDYKFERVYGRPHLVIPMLHEYNFHAICEPDYSTFWDWPFAARLWNVYRARWSSRHMQDNQLDIIPILRKTNKPEADAPWLYQTLPTNVPIMALNVGMMHHISPKDRSNMGPNTRDCIEACIAHTNTKTLLINSGADLRKYLDGYLPDGINYVYLQSYIKARNILLNKKRTAYDAVTRSKENNRQTL